MSQAFKSVDYLRLEVEETPTGLTNLIRNPSGELGAWGWVTPVATTGMYAETGPVRLRFLAAIPSAASYFYSENMPMTAGEYASASWNVITITSGYYRVAFEWLNSSGVLISTSTATGYLNTLGTNFYGPVLAPALTAYVRIRFDRYGNTSGGNPSAGANFHFNQVTVASSAVSTDLGTVRTNMVPNPSFVTDTKGWVAGATGSIARSTAQALHGTASLALTAATTYVLTRTLTGLEGIPVTPSTTYTMSYRARAATVGRATELGRTEYRSDGTSIASYFLVDIGFDTTTGWTTFSQTFTTGASTRFLSLSTAFYSTGVGEVHYIDGVMLEPGGTLGTYFDSSFTDAGGVDYASAVYPSVALQTRTNLCPNPSFETGTTFWAPSIVSPPTIASSSAQFFSGTKSLAVTGTGTEAVVSDPIPVTAGLTYKISASIRGSATSPQARSFYTYFKDSGGAVLSPASGAGTLDSTSAWLTMTATSRTAPAGAVSMVIELRSDMSGTDTRWWDAILVEQTSTAGTYFDGGTGTTTLDYSSITRSWSGTAHGSTSTQVHTRGSMPYSTATTSNLSYIPPKTYANILGPAHDIKVNREAMNIGTLSATILDAALDPSQDDLIRPGKACRLLAGEELYDIVTTVGAATRTNLCTNPSLETNLTGWASSGMSLTRGGAPSPLSVNSAIMTSTAPASAPTRTNLVPNPNFVNVTGWSPPSGGTLTSTTPGSPLSGAAGTLTGTTTSTRTNRFVNPSLEVNATPWATGTNSPTLARSTAVAFVGSACLSMTTTVASSATFWTSAGGTSASPVAASTAYTASMYVRAAATVRSVTLTISWYDAAGTFLTNGSTGSGATETTSSWTRVSVTSTSPSTAAFARVQVGYPSMALGEVHYVDGALFESGSSLLGYFDGATAASGTTTYAWSGTAHASTSVATTGGGTLYALYSSRPVTAGLTYTLSAYTRAAATTRNSNVIIDWYNGVSYLSTSSGSTVPSTSGAWVRPSVTATAPGTATQATVYLQVASMAIGEVHYIDQVLFEEAGSAGTYFDGATASGGGTTYAWTGTANASTSTATTPGSAADMYITNSTGIPVTVGQAYTASVYVRAASTTRNCDLTIQWWNGGSFLSQTTSTPTANSSGAWTRYNLTGTAPASATLAYVIITVDSTLTGEVHYADQILVEQAGSMGSYFDGSTTDVPAVPDTTPGTQYDWTGTAHGSTSTVSPTTSTNALVGMNWTPVFTGKIIQAEVSYDLKTQGVEDAKRARVEMHAVDANSDLANQQRPQGVGTIAELPYVLEGCGVPWSVNGSGNQVSSALVVATNENTSALDQVAITRDSVLGYAWVDRYGVIQVWDKASWGTSADAYLYESEVSDYDVSYNTIDCINEVLVKYQRYNPTTLSTEEVTYGPYRNPTSIATWGVRSATYTIQGIAENTTAIAAYADSVLTANANPVVRINAVTLPIQSTDQINPFSALIDLFDVVEVSLTAAGLNQDMFVRQVEHHITPEKWIVSYGFLQQSVVSTPTQTPSPNAGQTGATVGQLLRPAGEITLRGMTVTPAGWLLCNGSSQLVATYPRLHAAIGYTYGGSGANFTLPTIASVGTIPYMIRAV